MRYVDSVGLGVLIDLVDRCVQRGATVRFLVASSPVLRAFDAAGLLDALDVHAAGPSRRGRRTAR